MLSITTLACLQLQSSQSKHCLNLLLRSDDRHYTGTDLCFSLVTLHRWPIISTNASHLPSICPLTPTVVWKNSSIQLLALQPVSCDLHCIFTAKQSGALTALQEDYMKNVCSDFFVSKWPLSLFVLNWTLKLCLTQSEEALPSGSFSVTCLGGIMLSAVTLQPRCLSACV